MTARTYPGYTYDQIIIGAGSAAAMYLNTLRTYYKSASSTEKMPASILVIGMEDPWAGARGYQKDRYIENINQARQLFEHGTGAKASMDTDPVDRQQWARTNKGIIEEVTEGHFLNAEVKMVKKDDSDSSLLKPFLVETTSAGTFRASKIVIASGAGIETSDREYHMVPGEVKAYRESVSVPSPHVMDLDQFQKGLHGSGIANGKKVAVIGENAGTDAVMECATRGYRIEDVYWFMSASTNPGTALTWDISRLNPSFTAVEAGKDKNPLGAGGCVVRTNAVKLIAGAGNKIKVGHDGGVVEVDYFVYAKGQRGGGINRASRDSGQLKNVPFVHQSLARKLEPIYDVNQRFSDMENDNAGAWEHVVGIQLEGSNDSHGIALVGSAAVQVGRGISHNYLDAEYKQLFERLDGVTNEFRNCAVLKFNELNRFNKFTDMIGNKSIEDLSDSNFKIKRDNYVKSLVQKADSSARAVTGGSASEIIARVKERVEIYRKLASELCYLFHLRVKAAKYYHTLSQSGGRSPERPDQLQSAGLQRTLPETVSDGRLLGGMQRNISAVNQSHNVDHIKTLKGNNFLEDQQSLALYVAVHYPNIVDVDANNLVLAIMKDRKDKGRGFTPQEMGAWDFKLGQADREARSALGYAYKTYFSANV